MSDELFELWTYLASRPLTGLTVTLLAYGLGQRIQTAAGGKGWVNPVVIAVVFIGSLLMVTGVPYATYFEGAQFVHFLLGPATVALALPLHQNLRQVRRALPAVLVGVGAGSVVSSGVALGLAWALGAEPIVLRSLAPKSVTTPVAMALSEGAGGLPSLTAVLVILTGIVGVVLGSATLDLGRVRHPAARGLGFGVAAHGLGTARAFGESPRVGAFASLGMGLNALFTSLWIPLLLTALE
ncbi:MAG: LrgB family protein [Myxococcota bacterium]